MFQIVCDVFVSHSTYLLHIKKTQKEEPEPLFKIDDQKVLAMTH